MNAETLTKFYTDDHHRLDSLFVVFQDFKGKDPERAKEAFQAFRDGLEQHMAWEEAILFPEYEDRVKNPDDSVTEELRTEHAQILDQLGIIEEKLKQGDFQTAKDEARLLKYLGAHNRSEESGLYVKMDVLLTEEERDDIYTRMKQAAW